MAPVALPGEQREEVLPLDRCAAFPVPSRLLGSRGEQYRVGELTLGRLLQDWPAHSGLLGLGFSHTHGPISLTVEPGPQIRSSIYLIKDTPSISAQFLVTGAHCPVISVPFPWQLRGTWLKKRKC